MDREDQAFESYKRGDSPDALGHLLRTHQDRIYNICFQVLRHAEDSEDAAQSVLLEAIRWLPDIANARPFKVWLYRVAMNSSLKHVRARTRRVELASHLAAQGKSEGASMDSEETAALMEAIGGLDDPTRCLVLEYYFDKSTLEEIARREGVTSVAVWKRLEQARERMRKVLLGAGFLITGAGVSQGLESLTPVAAPAGWTISKSAVATAGGALVGAKSIFIGAVIAIVGVLIFITTRPSRSPVPIETGKADGAWPGEVRAKTREEAAPSTLVDGTPERHGIPEVRRRFLELFARRYPEWRNQLWRARQSPWGALDLIENKEVQELADWIASNEDPTAIQDLVGIFHSSKSDIGTFGLLLLVKGRHPKLEGFFTQLLNSKESDFAVSRLAAWGLSQIGSPEGLDAILAAVKESLGAEKGADQVYLLALSRTGEPGFNRLLALAEEQVRLGALTLGSFKLSPPFRSPLGIPFSPGMADRLKELATSHASPEIRVISLLSLLLSKQGDLQSVVFSRLRDDADPVVRERLKDRIWRVALVGGLNSIPSELRPELAEMMRQNKDIHPDLLLRAGIRFDPDRFLPVLRDRWPSFDRAYRVLFLSELAEAGTPETTRLFEEFALTLDSGDKDWSMLARARALTDPRVADKLFEMIQGLTDTSKAIRSEELVLALSKFPDSERPALAERLESALASASPSGRLAILTGLWRFESEAEATLLKTARTPSDGVEQLAAWNALSYSDRFTREAGLATEAKSFLVKMDPNLFGAPPQRWNSPLAVQYLNLVARTYMVAGTPADIPTLEKMAENPRVPFSSHPETIEAFQRAVRTAIDAIRLRSPN